jgi:hypothetical protein
MIPATRVLMALTIAMSLDEAAGPPTISAVASNRFRPSPRTEKPSLVYRW